MTIKRMVRVSDSSEDSIQSVFHLTLQLAVWRHLISFTTNSASTCSRSIGDPHHAASVLVVLEFS